LVADHPRSALAICAPPAAPVITGVTRVSGATLYLTGEASRTYILERSTDLGTWTEKSRLAAPSAAFTLTDPDSFDRAFYRARAK